MATKPATIFTFATDATFGSGPASGFATRIIPGSLGQGFIPGTGVNAEWVNYLFNVTGQWLTDWLDLGSFLATLDAHIVETNSVGEISVATAVLGGTAGAGPGLVVQENAGIQSATIFNSKPAGNALEIGATSTIAACIMTNNGVGLGLSVFSGGNGVDITAGGGLVGINVQGGGVAGIFEGAGTTGHGVIGIATGNEASGGIFSGAGNSAAAPLEAYHTAGGPFQRGVLYLNPSAIPTAALDGDVWKDGGIATFGRGRLQWWDDDGAPGGGGAGEQTAWSSENGLGFASFASLGVSGDSTAVIGTKVSGSIGINISPGDPDGKYVVEYFASVNLGLGAGLGTRCEVEFLDSSGVIETMEMDFTALGQKKPVSFLHVVQFVSIEALSIRFRTLSAGNLVEISNARIIARGAYE